MRLNVDLSTLLALGAAGYLLWQWQRGSGLFGGPSAELMQYHGQKVQPAIWETDWFKAYLGQGMDPATAEDNARQQTIVDNLNERVGYSNGGWGSL